jgi:hypothetical protein
MAPIGTPLSRLLYKRRVHRLCLYHRVVDAVKLMLIMIARSRGVASQALTRDKVVTGIVQELAHVALFWAARAARGRGWWARGGLAA